MGGMDSSASAFNLESGLDEKLMLSNSIIVDRDMKIKNPFN